MKRVSYDVEAEIIKIEELAYHFGEKVVVVTLAYQVPIPIPPQLRNAFPPPPKPVIWYHAIRLWIPLEKWNDQYRLGQKFKVKVYEDGSVEVKAK